MTRVTRGTGQLVDLGLRTPGCGGAFRFRTAVSAATIARSGRRFSHGSARMS